MNVDRFWPIFIVVVLFSAEGFCQEKLLKRSWIKHSIEEFADQLQEPDTAYLRYTFEDSQVLYGFEPGWHNMVMPYTLSKNRLKLGFDQWTIEALTDSTLTIFLRGFRRMHFYAEGYLVKKHLDGLQVGNYNGKPVYKADRIITPRYNRRNALGLDIHKEDRSDDYNIRKAGTFLMSFIVTDEGKIADPKILAGVAPGYDLNVVKELWKTSKHWTPATFKGQPVHTLLLHEVRFLDSFDQR